MQVRLAGADAALSLKAWACFCRHMHMAVKNRDVARPKDSNTDLLAACT